jgi:Mn2+/Fe2+ NRAMP family transporter
LALSPQPARNNAIDPVMALAVTLTEVSVGMAFSNLVAIAIIVTTAATLHAQGITDIRTSSQAAEALRPVARPFAFSVFTLGIFLGTGLLSVPVLAGSAAYAIGEARKGPTGLARQPLEAKAFYATLAIATLVGVALNFTSFDPIQALFWSAVINGVVAVPVMVLMMLLTGNTKVMGQFMVTGMLRFMGWLATSVMAAAVVGMLITAGMQLSAERANDVSRGRLPLDARDHAVRESLWSKKLSLFDHLDRCRFVVFLAPKENQKNHDWQRYSKQPN